MSSHSVEKKCLLSWKAPEVQQATLRALVDSGGARSEDVHNLADFVSGGRGCAHSQHHSQRFSRWRWQLILSSSM
jgi:hypothetical protein